MDDRGRDFPWNYWRYLDPHMVCLAWLQFEADAHKRTDHLITQWQLLKACLHLQEGNAPAFREHIQ